MCMDLKVCLGVKIAPFFSHKYILEYMEYYRKVSSNAALCIGHLHVHPFCTLLTVYATVMPSPKLCF